MPHGSNKYIYTYNQRKKTDDITQTHFSLDITEKCIMHRKLLEINNKKTNSKGKLQFTEKDIA